MEQTKATSQNDIVEEIKRNGIKVTMDLYKELIEKENKTPKIIKILNNFFDSVFDNTVCFYVFFLISDFFVRLFVNYVFSLLEG